MKKILFFILIFLSYQCWSQGNMIAISSTVPAQMTICNAAKTFTVSIYNPSPFLLTNDTLKVTMPTGITYQPGTVTGATYLSTSAPNTLYFLLASIPTLTTVNISYSAAASCDVQGYISAGGIIENDIRVNYSANNTSNFDEHTTLTYIVRQPNLSISAVTNQSYTGNIGDVFSRCITVINGGLGELDQFTLTDIHNSGVQISAVSTGTWVNTGNSETITLSGANFTAIGDGDNLFENGESITICETVNVINCISVLSTFEAYWGCNSQNCQSSVSTANVVFPNLIPNLVISPNNANIYFQTNSCVTQASQQQLRIVNTGLGQATNVLLDIFQATGVGYNPYVGSNIDPNSFTTQIGSAGAATAIVPTGTELTNTLGCMAATAIGRAYLTIPTINPGDTVYLKWNTYSCCWNNCAGIGQYYINGWRYKGSYENICENDYLIPEDWGKVYSYVYGDLVTNLSPSTLVNGQTGTFNFLFSNYNFWYPVGTGAHWKFEFTLPSCLVYSGNLQITHYDGISTWSPSSVNVVGNVVTAIFNGAAPFDLNQAEVKVNLTANCATCGGSGSGAVGIKSFYIPDAGCGCEVSISCQSAAVSIVCPSPCPEGLNFTYFDIKRTSYGLPDNESGGGNGLPDLSGSLNFTKIRTDRAMFGDTITSTFIGQVRTSGAYPSWQYCYATSTISNGSYLSFLDGALKIYRAGVLIASCNSFAPVITNSGTLFTYDLSILPLAGCLPAGFMYLNNDSLVFKPRYKVTGNTGGPILSCNSTNEFYVGDVPNPSLPANKFQCGTFNGNCSIIGYYFTTYGPDNFSVSSCDNIAIYHNYYLSIGPCCNNYTGGNLFPYEYRNWAHIKTLTSILPTGYTFVSATFNDVRTAGTYLSSGSPSIPINPINPNSSTLEFPVEQYFQGYGGTIPLGDDGFYGTLVVTIQPSCNVAPFISQGIQNDWTFATTSYLTGPGSSGTFISAVQDYITYEPPALFLQSTLPSVIVPDSSATWDISISNTSNVSNALNTWFSGPTISGVNVIEVIDLATNLPIVPVGEIYQVGTVNANAVRSFRITATFSSCLQDSIIVYAGWNCNAGYPVDVATYPCTPETIKLKLTPLIPALTVNVTGPAGTILLCDTATYSIEGVNVQLGNAYDVTLTATLPVGVIIVPGSSELSYPVANPFVSISDPVFISGTMWKWNISAINSTIGTQGLKGALESALNSLKLSFKVTTNCSYTSGSNIGFSLNGKAACGFSTGQELSLSSELGITGATTPYHTGIKLATTYISPCAANSTMKVVVINYGPAAYGIVDSVIVQLPIGVSFIPGSFLAIHNAPLGGTPTQYMLNGKTYLMWKLPQGIAVADSTVFNFDYAGDPQQLSCDISLFTGQTISSANVLCTLTGNNCGINIITGDTTLSVFTYKAYLSLSNASAVSAPNPSSGETVTVNIDITNTGQQISSGANSIIKFYYDANGNGVYNSSDVFITQDTLLVNNNATQQYQHTFNAPAGKACSIIAIVDTAVNPCVCNPSQIFIQPRLISLKADTILCVGETMVLSSAPVTGYTYSWTPSASLSAANVSNPLLTASAIASSTNYILTTNRMGCISKDTINITINPVPASSAGADIITCYSNTPGTLGAASVSGYSYSWFPTTGLSNAAQSNPSITLTNVDTTVYVVTTSSLGCSSTDSVTVAVSALPTATITGTTTICQSAIVPYITFTGAGTIAPYTFTYTINGVAQPTVTTNIGNSVSIQASTTANGTFTYTLVSVTDASSLNCSQTQTGTAIVTVSPKPSAAFSSTTVCNGNNTLFTDSSISTPGTITNWIWDLGDSSPIQNTQNISHIYDSAGVYTATLIATNNFGCADTITKNVQVYYNAEVNFTYNNVCFGDTIHFTDSSSVHPSTSIASYLWLFGDGSATSTLQNPSHYYSNAGSYTVTLVVNTADGCSVVINKVVKTFDLPVSAFNTSTTCLYDSSIFLNTSQNPVMGTIAAWSWNFGDGSPNNTTDWSPAHLYATPGIYQVTLFTSSSNLGCADTIQDSVIVLPKPLADFSFADACFDQTINFTDASFVLPDTILSWTWDFGDNSIFNSFQSPGHNYAIAGAYTVKLFINTVNGCKDTVAHNVVAHPLPSVDYNALNVCDGNSVSFTNLSTILPTDTIQSYSWTFGDGTAAAASQNTSHLYAAAGAYAVKLTVTSNFGCTDSITKTTFVNPNPTVNFTITDTIGCEPFCTSFQDASQITTGTNTQWAWNAGDGTPISNGQNFEHCYLNDSLFAPISYTPVLTVTSDSGCISILTRPNLITVYPKPVAAFTVTPTVASIVNPIITITNPSSGTDFWNWDFGDQNNSNVSNPLPHTYADTGSFTITLMASTQYNCVDVTYQTIVIQPDFIFYIPNSFTPNDDGINDTFTGKGIFIEKFEMSIFDRWGNLIFFSDDLNKPWDGKANYGSELAQMDVYVYIIKVLDINNRKHKYSGKVTLVK